MSESDGRIFRPTKPIGATLECSQVIMSVILIVVGAVYINDCPRQPYIPIYLLVMGVVSLLMNVLFVLPCYASLGIYSQIWTGFVFLFVFCWSIAGNVWIYSIYEPNYNKTGSSMDPYYNKTESSMDPYYNKTESSMDTYCNKTLYLFAFWTINLSYILLGFTIFISCCIYFLFVGG